MRFPLSIWILMLVFMGCNKSKSPSHEKVTEQKGSENPTVHDNPNKSLYWGDTHLHTTNSPDAFSFGARLTPDEAYRFAKGETIESEGLMIQLNRPLDFLVVADHAEGLGLANEVMARNELLMKDPLLQEWAKRLNAGATESSAVGRELINSFATGDLPEILFDRRVMDKVVSKIWSDYLYTAERHYQPGSFTTLAGYEWSSLPQGNNLHRVVVFRDGYDKTIQTLPLSSSLSSDPKDLWKALQAYEDATNGKVLAIPHNGNASNGLMFTLTDFAGNPMTKAYASLRSRWEPLVETTQIKGDSESHPFLSPNDEFAGYGIAGWDMGNLNLSALKTKDMYQYEYSREALKNGLMIEDRLGVNPYRFGLIGSTDSHTALATADRDNFTGKFTNMVNDAQRSLHSEEIGVANSSEASSIRHNWQYLSSGYAAVWAESNTREAIWDAMQRKEVYGTTGPRIYLRFFGGWEFSSDDVKAPNYAQIGYQKGVPMGSDLLAGDENESPRFMLVASKDPEGANLDRIQIIKGWTQDGKTYEKIFNVAWSGQRKLGTDGKLPLVGNTVDAGSATYKNTIGAEMLATVWTDPEFEPSVRSFYYVRVLEIPTPRWTTYDAARFKLELPADVPSTVQDRAYSSPIWYSPN